MAVQPNAELTFLNGLSDFWVAFFRDPTLLRAFYDGTQVAMGQLYLELCQNVLAPSLDHAPAFDREYYRLLVVREHEVRAVEGPTPADDRYYWADPEWVEGVGAIANRVVSPTVVLGPDDFEVAAGVVVFRADPFRWDGADPVPGFPVRPAAWTAPAAYASHRRTDWAAAGVRPGDVLQVRLQSAPPVEATVAQVAGTRLALASAPEGFAEGAGHRALRARVYRTPFDARVVGERVPTPSSVEKVSAAFGGGTTDLQSAAIDLGALPAARWTDRYVCVVDHAEPSNNGFYRVLAASDFAHTATLDRGAPFLASPSVDAYLVDFGEFNGGDAPEFPLGRTHVTPGTLVLGAKRHDARVLGEATYPAGGDVVEGVDYAVDYDAGVVRLLWPWRPAVAASASYAWRLLVAAESYAARGDWFPSSYARGDVVRRAGGVYVCVVKSSDPSDLLPAEWETFAPFATDAPTETREIAMWAVDARVDRDLLYNNFGHLLGFRKRSGEAYRAFLKGVSQLFLRGPSVGRFEGALNVAAGLPVVREDGETAVSYDDGYVELGKTGLAAATGSTRVALGAVLLDEAAGEDGVTDATAATLRAEAGAFLSGDAGAVVTLRVEDDETTHVVVAVAPDGAEAVLDPPPVSAANVRWRVRHRAGNLRLRSDHELVEYAFTDADLGAVVEVLPERGADWRGGAAYAAGDVVLYRGKSYAAAVSNSDADFVPAHWRRLPAPPLRDVGAFRIVAVDGPRQVALETPHGFTDARHLRWRLTREGRATLATDRRVYRLPAGVPVRAEAVAPGHVFAAFEPIADAIRVRDYVTDPTWWRDASVPPELMALDVEEAVRRRVTADFVPNVLDPVDRAVVGDPGLRLDADDEGTPGLVREGAATWLGGDWVALHVAPGLRPTDLGHHVTFEDRHFRGSYSIREISPDLAAARLDRFPPRSARGLTAPRPIARAALPTITYRRTVAFVVMDRLLKYHALHVSVAALDKLAPEFLADARAVLAAARPAYVHVFFETPLSLADTFELRERLELDVGFPLGDRVEHPDNRLRLPSDVAVGEYFLYAAGSVGGVHAGGALAFSLSHAFPHAPDRVVYVFGRFSAGTVSGRRPSRGRDFTLDAATGAVAAAAFDAGAYTFSYVACALKLRVPAPTPWWTGVEPGETPVVLDGADPLVRRPEAAEGTGLLERAVSITIA